MSFRNSEDIKKDKGEKLMKEYRNYLLFFPSLLRDNAPKKIYSVEGWRKRYEGIQTNEPVAKYLLDYLAKQDESFDRIIMLCSREVSENKVALLDENVSSKTTLQYLEEVIQEYIGKSDYSDLYAEGKNVLFEEISADLSRQTVDVILKPLERILQVASNEKGKKQRVFVDFTGGLRDSALALVFACRILQAYDVQVEKILYSNFNTCKVAECTKTYQYFDYLAAQIELQYGRGGKIVDYLRRELNAEENQDIEEYLKNIEGFFKNRKGNKKEALLKNAETIQQLSGYISDVMGENRAILELVERFENEAAIVTENKANDFLLIEEHLKNQDYTNALCVFREKVFETLLTLGVIEVGNERLKNNKKNLTNTVVGVYRYYGDTGEKWSNRKKDQQTFLQVTDRFIRELEADVTKEPEKAAEDWKKREYDLTRYLQDTPQRGTVNNAYSRRLCRRELTPYIEKVQTEKSIMDLIEYYGDLERIYLGVGYPFACVYTDYLVGGYDQLYRKNFDIGVDNLQKLYMGSIGGRMKGFLTSLGKETITYTELMKMLRDDASRDRFYQHLFPFQLNRRDICVREKTSEESNRFMYEFAKTFTFVKNVRNKDVHDKEKLDNEALKEAVNRMQCLMEQIKECIEQV